MVVNIHHFSVNIWYMDKHFPQVLTNSPTGTSARKLWFGYDVIRDHEKTSHA